MIKNSIIILLLIVVCCFVVGCGGDPYTERIRYREIPGTYGDSRLIDRQIIKAYDAAELEDARGFFRR